MINKGSTCVCNVNLIKYYIYYLDTHQMFRVV